MVAEGSVVRMGKKYTVEEYGITRRDGGNWDDQSAREVSEFDTLEEARAAFEAVDVRGQWLTEKLSSSLRLMTSKVMAAELCVNELDEDGEIADSEVIEYKEFGAEDYEKEEGR